MVDKTKNKLLLRFDKEKEVWKLMDAETFEIFITDLKEDVQKELIEFLGGKNGNYDTFPLITIYKDDENNDD